ncbi:hypothetical protein WUBG_09384 [Wuchereria bancrofti]|uniref:Uncharacterized protein n=1 Tax=Wuchereria bancrofti TaxID=6293 RepID=J9EC22_WUCBA|nr:hypothetical protein WUBG_09384 [Wuchereria bancrofti]
MDAEEDRTWGGGVRGECSQLQKSQTIDDDQEGDIVAKHTDGPSFCGGQEMAKLGRKRKGCVLLERRCTHSADGFKGVPNCVAVDKWNV